MGRVALSRGFMWAVDEGVPIWVRLWGRSDPESSERLSIRVSTSVPLLHSLTLWMLKSVGFMPELWLWALCMDSEPSLKGSESEYGLLFGRWFTPVLPWFSKDSEPTAYITTGTTWDLLGTKGILKFGIPKYPKPSLRFLLRNLAYSLFRYFGLLGILLDLPVKVLSLGAVCAFRLGSSLRFCDCWAYSQASKYRYLLTGMP